MNNVQLPMIDDDVRRKEAISILLKGEQRYALFVINEHDEFNVYTNDESILEEVEDWASCPEE